MVSKSEFISSDPRSFPGRRENDLCLNSDIMNLLLKTNGWKNRPISFCFGVLQLSVGEVERREFPSFIQASGMKDDLKNSSFCF